MGQRKEVPSIFANVSGHLSTIMAFYQNLFLTHYTILTASNL